MLEFWYEKKVGTLLQYYKKIFLGCQHFFLIKSNIDTPASSVAQLWDRETRVIANVNKECAVEIKFDPRAPTLVLFTCEGLDEFRSR